MKEREKQDLCVLQCTALMAPSLISMNKNFECHLLADFSNVVIIFYFKSRFNTEAVTNTSDACKNDAITILENVGE